MKKFWRIFFKEKPKFTGFEVNLWLDGKLAVQTVGSLEQVTQYVFPGGTSVKTPSGNTLSGYNLVPHLEGY